MKKILLVGLIVAAVGLAAGFAVPALGHGLVSSNSGTSDHGTWLAMHEACQEGDWDAMAETAQEVHKTLAMALAITMAIHPLKMRVLTTRLL